MKSYMPATSKTQNQNKQLKLGVLRYKYCISLLFYSLILFVLSSGAEPASDNDLENSENKLSLMITLADGSKIIGMPSTNQIQIKTFYTIMDVPFEDIDNINFEKNKENVEIRFANDDLLNGTIGIDSLGLATLFGKISIPFKHIDSIDVSAKTSGPLPSSLLKGLVMYYSFDKDEDGKVTDNSDKGHDGTVHGTKWIHKGKISGARKFDGTSEHITVDQDNNWNFPVDKFSIAFWVAPDSDQRFSGAYGFILGLGDAHNENSFGILWREKGVLQVYSSNAPIFGEIHIPANKWSHVVLTRSMDIMKLSINGNIFEQNKQSTVFRNNDIMIGSSKYALQAAFHGSIDEVMIFNRALSATEIKCIYNAQK